MAVFLLDSGRRAGQVTNQAMTVLDEHRLLAACGVAQGLAQVGHGGKVDFCGWQRSLVGPEGFGLQQVQAAQVHVAGSVLGCDGW